MPTEDPLALLRLFGLEEAANRRAGTYSKGMQQRLVLARCSINRPSIWFLDEPTAGLDHSSAIEVRRLIREKREEGTTIFPTTHDMHVADELCDCVAFINAGEIVALDTSRELKLRHGDKALKVEYRVDGRVETDPVRQGHQEDLRRFYELLSSGRVETVHSLEASLEAVFIALTGRELG